MAILEDSTQASSDACALPRPSVEVCLRSFAPKARTFAWKDLCSRTLEPKTLSYALPHQGEEVHFQNAVQCSQNIERVPRAFPRRYSHGSSHEIKSICTSELADKLPAKRRLGKSVSFNARVETVEFVVDMSDYSTEFEYDSIDTTGADVEENHETAFFEKCEVVEIKKTRKRVTAGGCGKSVALTPLASSLWQRRRRVGDCPETVNALTRVPATA